MKVTTETARFFRDQVAGTHNGHMAPIPHNPALHSLMQAHGVVSPGDSIHRNAFIVFLRECADALETEKPGF